ncbi:MAG: FAD-dependent oxidoreductase [Spirochaetaceae bacterium]|jgi:hypothetical protein|nr:FAD-dependent oxidoreductase [Spirochaetaceae bacterium]
MRTVTESAKKIPVLAETDILVMGGGPAGIAAAIAGAREGAEVILLERYGCFGGTLTQTGVEALAWYRHQGTVEAGGLLREMEAVAEALGASSRESQSDSQAIDPHIFRFVCDKMIEDAGVRPILHCMAVGAIIENGKFAGIFTESKSGRQAILAKRGIDCTGDADIAAAAGVPFFKAPREELMFVTQLFSCRGVDTKRFLNYVTEELRPSYRDWNGACWKQKIDERAAGMFSPYLEKIFTEALREGSLRDTDRDVSFGGTWGTVTPEGEVTQLNMVSIKNIDCTDVFDLTKAEIAGRRNCIKALEVLRKKVPGFEKARLRNFGMTIGTRESRLIEGLYTLSARDVFEQGRFDDSVAIFPEFIDGREFLVLPLTGRYYQIPYRALVPRGVDNLLVAGRCISGEPIAHTSFRNMACCVATGQAAGTGAACSLAQGVPAAAVDIARIHKALAAQGVRYV